MRPACPDARVREPGNGDVTRAPRDGDPATKDKSGFSSVKKSVALGEKAKFGESLEEVRGKFRNRHAGSAIETRSVEPVSNGKAGPTSPALLCWDPISPSRDSLNKYVSDP